MAACVPCMVGAQRPEIRSNIVKLDAGISFITSKIYITTIPSVRNRVSFDTMQYKIPVFTVDSIVQNLALDSAKLREDVYCWYAEGFRYPILEA